MQAKGWKSNLVWIPWQVVAHYAADGSGVSVKHVLVYNMVYNPLLCDCSIVQ